MKALNQFFFPLADAERLIQVKMFLSEHYVITELPSAPWSRTFYDSFDWRLYEKNSLCFLENGQLQYIDFFGEAQDKALACPESIPRFPAGVLASILKNRALLPQGNSTGTCTMIQIMNDAGEILALAQVIQAEPDFFALEVQAAQGGKKAWRNLIRSLEQFAPAQAFPLKQQLDLILSIQGRQATAPALTCVLTKQGDSRAAFQEICRSLLSIMQHNQQGIVDDVDIEFLHDFRVALRRTRSALTLFKGVLEPERQEHFIQAFRELGRCSGPLRDLDVQLEAAEVYRKRLPERLHPGFASLLNALESQRKQAQQELAQRLQSPEHAALFKAWQDYLEQDRGRSQAAPLAKVAQKILQRRFAAIWRDCQAIQADSSDQQLHQLRIQGKKFRYALEFFQSLYPEAEIQAVISILKNMQKHLGNYNDFVVQEARLEQALDHSDQVEAAAALGGLLTSFHDSRRHLQKHIQKTVSDFIEEIQVYRPLFKG